MRVSEFGRWFRFLSVVSLMLCGFSINTWATPSITSPPVSTVVAPGAFGVASATFTGSGTSSNSSTVSYLWQYFDGGSGTWVPFVPGVQGAGVLQGANVTLSLATNSQSTNPQTSVANGDVSTLQIALVPPSANGLQIQLEVTDASSGVSGGTTAYSAIVSLTVGATWSADNTLPSLGEAFERGALLPIGPGVSNVSILTIGGNNPENTNAPPNVTGINLDLAPGSNNGIPDAWTLATGVLPFPLVRPTTTLLPTGDVLIAGGLLSNGTDSNEANLYTPSTQAVAHTASFLFSARDAHTASLLPTGSVIVAGGENNGTILSTTEVYTPAGVGNAGTWTQAAPLNVPRYDHVATTLADGRILVTGGLGVLGPLNSAEIYDPIQNTWTYPVNANTGAVSTMTVARVYHTATLLLNGDVLIAGGYNSTDLAPLNTAEIFSPSQGTFTPIAATLITARDQATATLVASGNVLIAGGFTSAGATAASEYYIPSPAGGSFVATEPLATSLGVPPGTAPRDSAAAWLVPDGDVVVAGGLTTGGVSTATAEKFWDPAQLTAPAPSANIQILSNVVAGQLVSAACGEWNPTTGAYISQPGTQYAWSIVDGATQQPVLPVFGVSGGATTVQYLNYSLSANGSYTDGPGGTSAGDTSQIVFVVPIGDQGGTLQLTCLATSSLGIPAISTTTSVDVAPGTSEGRAPEAEIYNTTNPSPGNTLPVTVLQGATVMFTAEGVLGEPSLYDYQWQYLDTGSGWLNYPTAADPGVFSSGTGDPLTLTNVQPRENGQGVRAFVTNSYGTGISNVETLYVVASPTASASTSASTITSTTNNPAPYVAGNGNVGPVTLTCSTTTVAGSQVGAGGTSNTLQYQWTQTAGPGAPQTLGTASTQSFGGSSSALAGGVYQFTCTVTNVLNGLGNPTTSSPVTVTVDSLPQSVIVEFYTTGNAPIGSSSSPLESPIPTVLQGDVITFTTSVTGSPYPGIASDTYQWYFNDSGKWYPWGTNATQQFGEAPEYPNGAQSYADNLPVQVAVTVPGVGTVYSGPATTVPASTDNQSYNPILYVVTTPTNVSLALTNEGDGGATVPGNSNPIDQGNYAVITATDTAEPGNTTTYTWYKVGDNPTPGGPDLALNPGGSATGSLNVCGPLPAVPGAPDSTGGSLAFTFTAPSSLESSESAAQENNVLILQGACVADAGTFYAVAVNFNTNEGTNSIPLIQTSQIPSVEAALNPAPSYPATAPSFYSDEQPLVVNVGTWTPTGNLDEARYEAYSLLLNDNSANDPFFVGGGLNAIGSGLPPLKDDDLYHPVSGTWSHSGDKTNYDHLDGTATILPNGAVVIAGGSDGELDGQTGIDIYPAGGGAYIASNATLQTAGPVPYPVTQQVAALVTNTSTWTQSVLLAGGQNGSYSNFYSSALLYTPGPTPGTGDSIALSAGSLSVARAGAVATSLPGNRVLITGGQGAGGPVPNVDIYDGNTADFTNYSTLYPSSSYAAVSGVTGDFFAGATAAPALLPIPLLYHTATLLNDGRVLIAGGETTGAAVQNELWIWDPNVNGGAGGFYALGTKLPGGISVATQPKGTSNLLQTARARHNAVLLENGTVLIFGGFGTTGSELTSAEVVDPNWVWSAAIPNASTPASSLNNARALASATLLQDGNTVVAGGYNTTGALKSAELFSALETYSFPVPTGLTLPIIGTLNDGVLAPTGLSSGPSATLTFTPLAPFSFTWVQGPLYYSGVEITDYSWSVPSSAGTIISGQGTPTLMFAPATTGGTTIQLQVTDQWGVTSDCNIEIVDTGSSWSWSHNTCGPLL